MSAVFKKVLLDQLGKDASAEAKKQAEMSAEALSQAVDNQLTAVTAASTAAAKKAEADVAQLTKQLVAAQQEQRFSAYASISVQVAKNVRDPAVENRVEQATAFLELVMPIHKFMEEANEDSPEVFAAPLKACTTLLSDLRGFAVSTVAGRDATKHGLDTTKVMDEYFERYKQKAHDKEYTKKHNPCEADYNLVKEVIATVKSMPGSSSKDSAAANPKPARGGRAGHNPHFAQGGYQNHGGAQSQQQQQQHAHGAGGPTRKAFTQQYSNNSPYPTR
jgi:hypothetical protein